MNVVKNSSLLGRWQILQKEPIIICDSAHNEDGIIEIVKQLSEVDYKKLHFVLGFRSLKDELLCMLVL